MTILSKLLRSQLETAVKQAREIAEDAAHEAIARMNIADPETPSRLTDDNKALRRRLRAHARTLGDTRDGAGAMTTARLQDAASYEIWHRMLFGRFLAERGLLIHPEIGASMSVAELRDLAKEEGAADEWALAERYAAPWLPGVFKPNDPVLALPIAPEFLKRLRTVLSSLPEEIFAADDSLGWTYEFWRTAEKSEIDERIKRGSKVEEHELSAKTQLFTDSYMVKFILHNTLGAWWAGKVLAKDTHLAFSAADEETLREACAVPGIKWEFLRFLRDQDGKGPWQPAAGTFSDWPTKASDITCCDPCCGSGHFLVEIFFILAGLRQYEEGLSAENATVLVLRENLHGLELDGRCVQIATFNVALAAWKFSGSPISFPSPHIAWVGAPPPMSRVEMAALGNGDTALCRALETLHDHFLQAPLLGSLLEIGARDLLEADLRDRSDAALAALSGAETESSEGAIAARGLLDAAKILGQNYVLVATNVPYLGKLQQPAELVGFIARHFPNSKGDLCVTMLERLIKFLKPAGTLATVTKQEWAFLGSYEKFRKHLLNTTTIDFFVALGEEAWESFGDRGPLATLAAFTSVIPTTRSSHFVLDLSKIPDRDLKIIGLCDASISRIEQSAQVKNPNSRILTQLGSAGPLLEAYARSFQGLISGDGDALIRFYWEVADVCGVWRLIASTGNSESDFSGLHSIVRWGDDGASLARRQGLQALGSGGVAVGQMRSLPVSRYLGSLFDNNIASIIPKDEKNLPAIYLYCTSDEYKVAVRKMDSKKNVTNATLVKVPFDCERWNTMARSRWPNGLPEPYSDDPTQWLFHGHPAFARPGTELHVALARLAGYQWPSETDRTMRLSDLARERIQSLTTLPISDHDGLLPLHADSGASPLGERLRAVLDSAYGEPLSMAQEQALVRKADALFDKKEMRDATLEGWLADRAFRQHCVLFEQAPFLWHVWDGMKEGFSAFLHYHRLDRAALDKLTYTVLGDWIRTARAEGNIARLERAEQLQQKLAKIIEGEAPYDIFVRWKPLAKQPLGWDPDFDDGVRLNIRPFVTAGILREQPKGIAWNKDRGTDVPFAPWYDLGPRYGGKPGDRINDHHTTLAEKRAARGTS